MRSIRIYENVRQFSQTWFSKKMCIIGKMKRSFSFILLCTGAGNLKDFRDQVSNKSAASHNVHSRLAHKSSSKSAKRDRAPCLEARSAIVGARASECVARASESSTCFPCWKSNQVTLFWRELFRVRSCLKGLKLSKLLFACLMMGSKPRLFCADQPRLFPSCFTNSRKYIYLLILNVMGL